jgi:hypothetical protein
VDQAWQKGLEQAKPYLGYSPKAWELVVWNKETLMRGNLTELWKKVRIAAKVGGHERSQEVYQGDGGQGQGQAWQLRRRVGLVFQFDPRWERDHSKVSATKGGYREAWGGGEAGEGSIQGDLGGVV